MTQDGGFFGHLGRGTGPLTAKATSHRNIACVLRDGSGVMNPRPRLPPSQGMSTVLMPLIGLMSPTKFNRSVMKNVPLFLDGNVGFQSLVIHR
jgi:hypothetical protein